MSQSLSLPNSEILTRMATVIGISRDYENDWDANTLADARGIIRSGLRRFYHAIDPRDNVPYQWRFLEKRLSVPAQATYETGTVAISAGTVTLTTGTWPAWAGDGLLYVEGRALVVVTRDSDSALTIENTALTVDAGTTYTLDRWRVSLGADFGELIGKVLYRNGQYCRPELRSVDESEIRIRYESDVRRDGPTIMYAVERGNSLTSGDQSWYLTWWPFMEAESHIGGIYRAVPLDRLDNADLTADGAIIQAPPAHAETLLLAILSAAEASINEENGIHSQRYDKALAASIELDRRTPGPKEIDEGNRIWRFNDHVTATYEL